MTEEQKRIVAKWTDDRGYCPFPSAMAEELLATVRVSADNNGEQSVAKITGADEYGPLIQWKTHWVDLVGKALYIDAPHSASDSEQQPVAWRDPGNIEPGQSVTFKKEVAEKWPHIYKQPLYAEPPIVNTDLNLFRAWAIARLKEDDWTENGIEKGFADFLKTVARPEYGKHPKQII